MTEQKPSRAERLDAIVLKLAPKAAAYHKAFGAWPGAASFTTDGNIVPPKTAIARLIERLRAETPEAKAEALEVFARAADAARRAAPYVIDTLVDGGRRGKDTSDEGD